MLLSAICALIAPMYLSNAGLLGTNCLEPNLWMGCAYFAILAIKRNNTPKPSSALPPSLPLICPFLPPEPKYLSESHPQSPDRVAEGGRLHADIRIPGHAVRQGLVVGYDPCPVTVAAVGVAATTHAGFHKPVL